MYYFYLQLLDSGMYTRSVNSGRIKRLFQMYHSARRFDHWIFFIVFYQFCQRVEFLASTYVVFVILESRN